MAVEEVMERYYCRATLAFSIDIEESSMLGYREDLYRLVQTTNPLRRELIEKQPRPQLKPCGFCDEKRCSEQFGEALDSRGEIYRVPDRCIFQALRRPDAADDCRSRVNAYPNGERPFTSERQVPIELLPVSGAYHVRRQGRHRHEQSR